MHKYKSSLSQEKCTSTRAHSVRRNAQVQEHTQSGEMHKYKSSLSQEKCTSTRAHWQAAQKTHKYKSTQAAQKTHKYKSTQAAQKTHKYKSTQAGSTENAQVQEHTGSTENAQVRARFVLGRFSDELVCPQAIPP
jgi:hypothetical protein